MELEMTFSEWLREQWQLQVRSYGVNPMDLQGPAMAEYVRRNVLAATDELHEALRETRWKPWAPDQGPGDILAFRDELVDVMFFLANLFLVAGASGQEVAAIYRQKVGRNAERVAAGEHSEMKGAA